MQLLICTTYSRAEVQFWKDLLYQLYQRYGRTCIERADDWWHATNRERITRW